MTAPQTLTHMEFLAFARGDWKTSPVHSHIWNMTLLFIKQNIPLGHEPFGKKGNTGQLAVDVVSFALNKNRTILSLGPRWPWAKHWDHWEQAVRDQEFVHNCPQCMKNIVKPYEKTFELKYYCCKKSAICGVFSSPISKGIAICSILEHLEQLTVNTWMTLMQKNRVKSRTWAFRRTKPA